MAESSEKKIEQNIILQNQFKSGADWFFWIAGLSLINSLIVLAGANWSFIVGLGATQVIDGFAIDAAREYGFAGKAGGFIFDCVVAGVFVLFGVFARKKQDWAFIAGMTLYFLDALLFLMVQDWLSIGFHAFALVSIFSGFKAKQSLSAAEIVPAAASQPPGQGEKE